VLFKTSKQFLILCESRRRLIHHDDIEAGQLCLVLSEGFANNSLESIPAGRQLAVLLGYSEAEPRILLVIWSA
jgi:hypothetical protein